MVDSGVAIFVDTEVGGVVLNCTELHNRTKYFLPHNILPHVAIQCNAVNYGLKKLNIVSFTKVAFFPLPLYRIILYWTGVILIMSTPSTCDMSCLPLKIH